MFSAYLSFAILLLAVFASASSYFLLKQPQLVEKYAKLMGSLNATAHGVLACILGTLAVLDVLRHSWFTAALFAGCASVFVYFLLYPGTPVKSNEQA
ncbi:MAG: hypothetical protein QM775_21645 [Pirellulales bacterium]